MVEFYNSIGMRAEIDPNQASNVDLFSNFDALPKKVDYCSKARGTIVNLTINAGDVPVSRVLTLPDIQALEKHAEENWQDPFTPRLLGNIADIRCAINGHVAGLIDTHLFGKE